MQWQLLSKEAALGSLKQQIADTKETACQAGAAQQVVPVGINNLTSGMQKTPRRNYGGVHGGVTHVQVNMIGLLGKYPIRGSEQTCDWPFAPS